MIIYNPFLINQLAIKQEIVRNDRISQLEKGFTLIELMIVMGIIGILAAIAIPAYNDYTIRTQVTDGINLALELKTKISEYNATKGALPSSGTDSVNAEVVGAAQSSSYSSNFVSSIHISDSGGINITYGNRANTKIASKILSIRPAHNASNGLVWICGTASPSLPNVIAPLATNQTNLDNKYLPRECRA